MISVNGREISEAAVLSGLGGILGVAIGWPFVELGIGRWLEENMGGFFPFFRVPPLMALLAVVLAVCLGVIAAIGPARGAARLEVTEALRRVA